MSADEIGLRIRGVRFSTLPMEDVMSVEVRGGEVSKRKVGAVLTFGVLGGLAAKGAKNQTVVVMRTRDHETAYYQIDKKSPTAVRAQITPILLHAGVALADESLTVPAESAVIGFADRLRDLSALHDEGLLTDEEFATEKAKALAK